MKSCLMFFTVLAWTYVIHGQNLEVAYGRLNNGVYTRAAFQTREITSDYGMRDVGGGASNFHRGIDYAPDGHLIGDAVLSIETGTIRVIHTPELNPKYIIIEGDNGGFIFAYLHIFQNGELPLQRGQFILDVLPSPNSNHGGFKFQMQQI